jgi:hypothetical protein
VALREFVITAFCSASRRNPLIIRAKESFSYLLNELMFDGHGCTCVSHASAQTPSVDEALCVSTGAVEQEVRWNRFSDLDGHSEMGGGI